MIEAIIKWFKKPEPTLEERELEMLDCMDRLRDLAAKYDRLIRTNPRSAKRPYWERKWEELVCVHMEFEWMFNPSNEDNFWAIAGRKT